MPIVYTQMTQEEQDVALAEILYAREREHFEYDLQAQHQEALLADLPQGDWPSSIAYLKGKSRDEMVMAAKDTTDLALAADYAERDRIAVMYQAAKIERTRVERYHAQTAKLMPPGQRAVAAKAAAAAKRV